ncbi:MAG: 2OG-Fe(II) oxygenase family protein [Deltaproteobacteria bacterium]|nr:2OG-Fe(II) oxygenase family protein [Deltaproteobacteria bacterium]
MSLQGWINDIYIQAYEKGELQKIFCKTSPFKHAILPDFFTEAVLEKIELYARQIPTEISGDYGLSKDANWYWGPFGEPGILRFIYGKAFRSFLNQLLGEPLQMRATSVPQYNFFSKGSKGIPIHNDYGKEIDVVMLLQLSRHYQAGLGGELCFHIENPERTVFKTIPPQANTLTLFKVAKNSYHSVSDMYGGWERKVVAFDWFIEGGHANNTHP